MYPEFAAFFADGAEQEDYVWEAHEVVTADGYVKTLFHITGLKSTPEFKATKQPVLLVNGA